MTTYEQYSYFLKNKNNKLNNEKIRIKKLKPEN